MRPSVLRSGHFLILAAALLVHLAAIQVFKTNPLSGDALQFSDEANAILAGKGWINTEGPGQATTTYPTQVFFLLACKAAFGRDAHIVPVVLQHLMVLATAYFVFRTALLLALPRATALVAMAIAAFFPHAIFLSNVLISHTIGMFFAVLGMYLVMSRPRRGVMYLAIGIAWGLASLARFTVQYFVPLWIVIDCVMALRRRSFGRHTIARNSLLLAGFLALMTPWYLRVHKYEGGNSGYTDAWRICYSFNRPAELRGNDYDDVVTMLEGDTSLTRSQREAQYKQATLKNLRSHPEWFINNALTNISFMLVNVSTDGHDHVAVYVGIYLSMLIGFGGVGLLAFNRAQHELMLPVYLTVLVIGAIHVPIYGYLANAFPAWMGMLPAVAHGLASAITNATAVRQDNRTASR